MCGCPCPDARGLGWEGADAREDVNYALQGMRLVRSWSCGEFKGICVCHTNQKVSLRLEANLNRRPGEEDDTTFSAEPGPEKEAVTETERKCLYVCVG